MMLLVEEYYQVKKEVTKAKYYHYYSLVGSGNTPTHTTKYYTLKVLRFPSFRLLLSFFLPLLRFPVQYAIGAMPWNS